MHVGSCFVLKASSLHRQWKITLRSDSKKMMSLVLCGKFSKRSYKKIAFLWGRFSTVSSRLARFCPFCLCLHLIFWALVKQIIYTPRVGFMIFVQIVENSTTVGRRMTTGCDSLPLVSFSDTYQPLRNRNNRSYVEGPQWVTAGRDSRSGGLTTYRTGEELAVIECKVTCSRDSKGRAPSLDSYFCP